MYIFNVFFSLSSIRRVDTACKRLKKKRENFEEKQRKGIDLSDQR